MMFLYHAAMANILLHLNKSKHDKSNIRHIDWGSENAFERVEIIFEG